MKFLILGSKGFIGSNVSHRLKKSGHTVVDPGRTSLGEAKDLFSGAKIDWVMNFASRTSITDSFNNAIHDYKNNIDAALAALTAATTAGASLLHISSYVYDGEIKHPAKEGDAKKAANPYMGSKIAIEQILSDLSVHMGLPLVIFRPSNIYGYGQKSGMLVNALIKSAQNEGNVVVNDAIPVRDYLFIEDFCDCVEVMLANQELAFGETFNIGSGEAYSNLQVAELVRKAASAGDRVIVMQRRRKSDIVDASVDVSKFQETFKWSAKFSLSQGINRMLELEQNQ